MKYYVIADPHGFFTPMRGALEAAGFFDDVEPHRLVLCGDMMDRGEEACEMQAFMAELLARGELIFVRGNHEDLMESLVTDVACGRPVSEIHEMNGTWGTAVQLSGVDKALAARYPLEVASRVRESEFWRILMPASVDYFETEHYVFVHGWLPYSDTCQAVLGEGGEIPPWREAPPTAWKRARWANGMECACLAGYREAGKTVVAGHWHASYGHAVISRKCSEHGEDAINTPFYAEGIIALDACTARSGRVNCIVLED